MKIGTHNSVTGETSHGILSWLVIPFSRCQSKSIKEQYEDGCRYFDIRVKETKRGWVCAHGLWTSRKSADDILSQLNGYGNCYVRLTYEGKSDTFQDKVDEWVSTYDKISFTSINVKKPEWRCIRVYNNVPMQEKLVILDGRSWHTYLPIPWLWKKIYYNKPKFNDDYFTNVDFL